jgi:putative peptidoglycan lipid II flippase
MCSTVVPLPRALLPGRGIVDNARTILNPLGVYSSMSRLDPSRASLAAMAGTGVSRIGGFLRLVLFNSIFGLEPAADAIFGLEPAADAFWAAFRLPATLRGLLAEGSLSASFLPELARTSHEQGPEAARRLARALLGSLLALSCLAWLLAHVLAGPLVSLLAPGFDPDQRRLTVTLLRLLLPLLPAIALSTWAMAALHLRRRFLLAAAAPALLSAGQITGLLLGATPEVERYLHWVALATTVGGLLQVVVLIAPLLRTGLVGLRPMTARVRSLLAGSLPVTLAQGAHHLVGLTGIALASWLGTGSVAAMHGAQRLYMLPLGLFGASVAAVSLAQFSHQAARGQARQLREAARQAYLRILLFALPSSIGLTLFARPVVRLVFQRGRFSADDTERVAPVLLAFAAGLVFLSVLKLAASCLHAQGDTWLPALLTLGALAAQVALALLLMPRFRLTGIAAAGVACSALLWLGLLLVFARRVGWPLDRVFMSQLWRMLVGAGLMGLVARAVALAVGLESATGPALGTRFGLVLLSALLSYGLLLAVLRVPARQLWGGAPWRRL